MLISLEDNELNTIIKALKYKTDMFCLLYGDKHKNCEKTMKKLVDIKQSLKVK